ncbi:MAG: hypothetical protein KF893_09105 [Caldilineaceae bacterium]|nr:hypothetical protein [Caldilineaceae bacterium]
MKSQAIRPRRRRRGRRPEEQDAEAPHASARSAQPFSRLGPHYNAGPVHELSARPFADETISADEEQTQSGAHSIDTSEDLQKRPGIMPHSALDQQQIPTMEGEGEPVHEVAFNRSGPLRLHGRTDATYDGGAFRTENVTQEAATGCAGCEERQCVHVTGTLVATYSVQTRVTLPSVSDFPDLTPCQQRRVQDAINNVLVPHEQEHVRAFEGYNGVTRRAFDLTLCRSAFAAAIQQMFEAEERARRAAAQAASDALDPFNFDVDLDCEEPTADDE